MTTALELVTQSELHHSRIGEQAAVSAERRPLVDPTRDGRDIEALQVRDVKHFPTEEHAVRFVYLPALAQAHVQAGIARSTHDVALSALSRKQMPERTETIAGFGQIRGEEVYRTIRTYGGFGMDGTSLNDRPAQLPVGRPGGAIEDTYRESAGPASQAG